MKRDALHEPETEGDIHLRQIACELNPLTRPDGSALYAQGGTCVLVSTKGPIESKQQHLKNDQAHVECIYKSKSGLPSIHDKLRQNIIRDTCESALLTTHFPRTTIYIQVQELDNRCGLDACAINASCMALMIAGLPMEFMYAAVHCIVNRDNELVLDPDHLQAKDQLADFTFVFESLEKNLLTVHTGGRYTMAQFSDAELMSRAAVDIIFKFYRKLITQFHSKSVNATEAADSEIKTEIKEEPVALET